MILGGDQVAWHAHVENYNSLLLLLYAVAQRTQKDIPPNAPCVIQDIMHVPHVYIT